MGGDDAERAPVTDQPSVWRVFLDGKWIASKPSLAEAEKFVAEMLREWDGVFSVVERRVKT